MIDITEVNESEVIQGLVDNYKEVNNGDMSDTITNINEILALLNDNPNSLKRALESERDYICESNNLCKCGAELQFKADYDLLEYQCSPVGQQICPNGCDY